MIRHGLALLVLLLIASPALARDSYEQRCYDLENDADATTTCICSEPMNSNQVYTNPDNFDDSIPGDGYECNTTNNLPGFNGDNYHPVADSATDSDYADIDYILGFSDGATFASGNGFAAAAESLTVTDMTWCVRIHMGWEHGWIGPYLSNDDQAKIFFLQNDGGSSHWGGAVRLRFNNSTQNESNPGINSFRWDHGSPSEWDHPGGLTFSCDESSGTATLADFYGDVDGWVEICADHNSREAPDNDKLYMRMKITAGNGENKICNVLSTNSNSTNFTVQNMEVIKHECRDWDSSGDMDCTKDYYKSHLMIATKNPADETFWIGGAIEITGGAETDPPTPDPPTAWTDVPAEDDENSISMTGAAGSDATTPVNYQYHCTSGGSNCIEHPWGTGGTAAFSTPDNLDADTEYCFRYRMRDSVGTPNVTGWLATPACATTDAAPVATAGDLPGTTLSGVSYP